MLDRQLLEENGLYSSVHEHDSCGMGFVANVSGEKSHDIIKDALDILVAMTHRGAVGSDPLTGDGAGLLTQIPHSLFVNDLKKRNIELPEPGKYGVGMIFLPKDNPKSEKKLLSILEKQCKNAGLEVIAYRDVPGNNKGLGKGSLATEPKIVQIFLKMSEGKTEDLDMELYLTRKRVELEILESSIEQSDDFYICSFSSKTIIYKGQFLPIQVESYYEDLRNPEFKSALALMHSRFSTNTFPSWKLAQPFRFLCHNGEINTVIGNRKWMRARQSTFHREEFGEELNDLYPIMMPGASDTASLDNAMEFFSYMGREIPHVLMMMIPEVWESNVLMSQEKKDFYEYHATMMEPWDGPSAVVTSDGRYVGAVLDRNGLRPSRYILTKSGKLIVSSEVGTKHIEPKDIKKSGRLQPGMMLLLDTEEGQIIQDNEIKHSYASKNPYGEWLKKYRKTLNDFPKGKEKELPKGNELFTLQKIFGYTEEDKSMIFKDMGELAKEPIASMGSDTPLSVLSDKPKLLYTYFKQLFAQVTNPPIDPIRERCVMSLTNFLGGEQNILEPSEMNAQRIKIDSPLLTAEQFHKIEKLDSDFKAKKLSILFEAKSGKMEKAIKNVFAQADEAIKQGYDIIILSDNGVNKENAAIPALLAVSGLHLHTVRNGTRKRFSIILETAEAREVGHFAVLSGCGVDAVYPYLAYATLTEMASEGEFDTAIEAEKAIENYLAANISGLLKIFSKMGISTFQSYQGAQIYEAVGLKSSFVNEYFEGIHSRIEGIGIEEIEKETLIFHNKAFTDKNRIANLLDWGGEYQWRKKGEKHLWNPDVIVHIQRAVRENNQEEYDKFAELINNQNDGICTIRGMFDLKKGKSIPIEEVEPVSSIVKRFVVSAMSFGSISKEAHENLAIAMNRLGAMSNSGEGGEDPRRFTPYENGDLARTTVKQVASGRFGVSSHFLVNGDEMQIKIAQGAKPGEGGHLPGHKVSEVIAAVRNSTPGVSLISPPPHHDIYSIEDLAQLIFDLKNTNPDGRVSVKLVSEVGVGTIAAGVAKAHADMILISGFDGGTGASPASSIKHAGLPWELGLSETHQTLVLNDLRSRVRLQVDGQLRTGKDVVIGALLGAEEFGFGTSALIAEGCVMMRKCQKNLCPVGIATQNPELRKRFTGKVEHIVNYFTFIAEEIRKHMASMGFRKFDEMVGRSDMINVKDVSKHFKAKTVDVSRILYKPEVSDEIGVYCTQKQDHGIDEILDRKLIEFAMPAILDNKKVEENITIKNIDRTAGAMLGGLISKKLGKKGLPEDSIVFNMDGYAGQSFGAFLVNGITFHLTGQANDYVGKGMSGGKITIKPHEDSDFDPKENIIAGNTLLYGATGGELYIKGVAGERFGVRNSGTNAVVEGIGDHGCEYMTGGRVVILGKTGINFGAGMSGGIAYVFDEDNSFEIRVNKSMVELEKMDKEDEAQVKQLIENHLKYTGSDNAKTVLNDWENSKGKFIKVMPTEYKRVLLEQAAIKRAKGV